MGTTTGFCVTRRDLFVSYAYDSSFYIQQREAYMCMISAIFLRDIVADLAAIRRNDYSLMMLNTRVDAMMMVGRLQRLAASHRL